MFRTNSNTPLQALDLLNDPTFVEAARVFGEQILQYGGKNLQSQLDGHFSKRRPAGPTTTSYRFLSICMRRALLISRLTAPQAMEYLDIGDSPCSARSYPRWNLPAMSNVARAIINLHEVITRD